MTTKVQRPGAITALCITAIVLGSLGLLTGFVGIAAQLFQGQMQSALANLQPDEEAAKLQQQVAEDTNEAVRKHAVRNWIFAIARLLLAAGLLAGGVLCWKLKPLGRKVLLIVFAAGIPFEALQVWPLLEARELTAKTFDRMMQAEMQKQPRPQAPPGFDASMKTVGRAIALMQLVIFLGMLLAKCGFYAFGLWYLTRLRNAGLFLRPDAVDPLLA